MEPNTSCISIFFIRILDTEIKIERWFGCRHKSIPRSSPFGWWADFRPATVGSLGGPTARVRPAPKDSEPGKRNGLYATDRDRKEERRENRIRTPPAATTTRWLLGVRGIFLAFPFPFGSLHYPFSFNLSLVSSSLPPSHSARSRCSPLLRTRRSC